MRNYQYLPEQESQMDDFGNQWKKLHRGVKGPSAWREFKKTNEWAKKITADALRQKYIRMKRDQYWRNYALAHAACPMGHTSCLAPNPITDFTAVCKSIEEYISHSTESINPSTIVMPFGTVVPNIVFAPAFVIARVAPTAAIAPISSTVAAAPDVPTVAIATEDDILVSMKSRSTVSTQPESCTPVSVDVIENAADTTRDLDAEEDELIRWVIHILEGLFILSLIDGRLMLVSRHNSKNISSVEVREVLHQAKRVLMHHVGLKCEEFEHRFSILAVGNNSESKAQVINHLDLYLTEEIDALVERLESNTDWTALKIYPLMSSIV